TPLGFAISSFVTLKFFLPALGSGVPQIFAALGAREPAYRGALLSVPIASAKFIFTILAQFSGGSVGQEGPMQHIGAALMYSVGRYIPVGEVSRHQLDRMLILGGSAAGIAATFCTPFAGIIFALEQFTAFI